MHNISFVLLRRLRLPLIVLISVYAISILGFVLIPGQDADGNLWRMDFFHAFYFVSFMGTTIGFGEIPYPFTDAQRMWTVASIYATVVAWLYGIGSLLSALRDPAFRSLLTENAFRRSIRRVTGEYFLVCGYGDTGSMLVKALTEAGMQAVVIEISQERINVLQLEDLRRYVPGLLADAGDPDKLMLAGLSETACIGVVALTNDDGVNLKIAITSKLLNPQQLTIARAEHREIEANIASFGTEQLINPFETFAGRLALALHSPGTYLLYEWMTSVPHEPLTEPLFPPRGTWILCGYGRFGKAVYERLLAEGIEVTVVEARPDLTRPPSGAVIGTGTEAVTLQEAGISEAVGIVAGTNNDANNLSILMTARDLNPDLFMVARQNSRNNDAIFQAAKLDLIMQRGSIIAHKIFALIQTPLLEQFLYLIRNYDNEWANQLVSRISGVTGDEAPETWEVDISHENSPALYEYVTQGGELKLGDIYRHPRDRDDLLPCLPLMCRRDGEDMVLPDDGLLLHPGDRLLFCGQHRAKVLLEWLRCNRNVLSYVLTGEEHVSGYLWKWFNQRFGHRATTAD
jgi:Trk K+ transport system NAD-binding subunit